jgi:hypothetical protein
MRLLLALSVFLLGLGSLQAQKAIQGSISNDGKPLSPVHVINLKSGDKTTSNSEGRYQILAHPKEELQFTYMGMDTVSIIVEDVTRILNINMELRVEELDEVTVSEKRIKTYQDKIVEYQFNKNMIKSSFGFLDKETASYSLRIINEDDFERAPTINSVIMGKFAGVNASCDPSTDVLSVSMRPTSSISQNGSAIFDVDGQIMTEVNCSWLFGNVRRMAFIPSYSATAKYGTLGKGGVVVINTKTGTSLPAQTDGKPYDHARLTNNYYDQSALTETSVVDNAPQYLKDLKASTDKSEAISLYQTNAAKYRGFYPFALESFRYFSEKWGDQEFADQILDQNKMAFADNPVALKALAYVLEAQNKMERAHEVYKEVYILRPDYAQSFIDLANSYRNLGNVESATTLYARHAYLQDEGMLPKDTVDLSRIMKRELNNLFALDNGTLKIKKRKSSEDEGYSTRLVFDWNDSEAEFVLQFVNPGDQYFKWNHSMEEMPERIRSEKELGYSMADFLLDDELPGVWKINATYLGNKQLTPVYLKATIYRNYGSKLQSKEVKVFRLALKGVNRYLFELTLPSEVVQSK